MKVFISHSTKDNEPVERIAERLTKDGHDVWVDTLKLRPGDNFQKKIEEGLHEAEALIVVISENSIHSRWVQQEFSTIALQQLSKREQRVIPIRIDRSEVPSYLADRWYLDFAENFAGGLEKLSAEMRTSMPKPVVAFPEARPAARTEQVQKLGEALRKGKLTLVCGAGVSVEAGVPSWNDLLVGLLEAMMERLSKDNSWKLDDEAAARLQSKHGASSLILGKYLKNNLGKDFLSEMRTALYARKPTTSALIDGIVALSRPQRDSKPLDSIVTFNFDSLIEENLSAQNIPARPIFSAAIKHDSNELPIYHAHGYLPRSGAIHAEADLVFSEDAYHSQFIDPYSWSNMIQLNKLTQSTCLFIGISLTDPNMRRLLDVAWRKSPDKTCSHYIVKKLPSDGDGLAKVLKLLEEQDANELGLNVVWIKDFDELPGILHEIAKQPNWLGRMVSPITPLDGADQSSSRAAVLATPTMAALE